MTFARSLNKFILSPCKYTVFQVYILCILPRHTKVPAPSNLCVWLHILPSPRHLVKKPLSTNLDVHRLEPVRYTIPYDMTRKENTCESQHCSHNQIGSDPFWAPVLIISPEIASALIKESIKQIGTRFIPIGMHKNSVMPKKCTRTVRRRVLWGTKSIMTFTRAPAIVVFWWPGMGLSRSVIKFYFAYLFYHVSLLF